MSEHNRHDDLPWEIEGEGEARLIDGGLAQCVGCHKGFLVRAVTHEREAADGLVRQSMPGSFACTHCGGVYGDPDSPRQVQDGQHFRPGVDADLAMLTFQGGHVGDEPEGDPMHPVYIWDCPECAAENWDWVWLVDFNETHATGRCPFFVCCRSCHQVFRAAPASADGIGGEQ